jgi:hypothetical protein
LNVDAVLADGITALGAELINANAFSLNIGSDPASPAASISVPVIAARTGVAYGSTYEDGNTTFTAGTVNLNTHLKCSWHVTEAQAMATNFKQFEMEGVECAKGLGRKILSTAFELITAANFNNTANTHKRIVAASAFDTDELIDIMTILRGTKKWAGDVNTVLTSTYYGALKKDPAIKNASASTLTAGITGEVQKFSGHLLFEDMGSIAATTTPASENLVGFCTVPGGILLGVRPTMVLGSDASGVIAEVATDPKSGLSMSTRIWRNNATGDFWGTHTVVMGVGVGDADRLFRILSA